MIRKRGGIESDMNRVPARFDTLPAVRQARLAQHYANEARRASSVSRQRAAVLCEEAQRLRAVGSGLQLGYLDVTV